MSGKRRSVPLQTATSAPDPSGAAGPRGRQGAAEGWPRLSSTSATSPNTPSLHEDHARRAPGRSAPAWPRWAGRRPASPARSRPTAGPAIALVGDGAFNMRRQVVATAVEYDLPGDLGDPQQLRARHRAQGHGARLQAQPSVVPFRAQGYRQAVQSRLRRSWPTPTARKAFASRSRPSLAPALERAFASRRPWIIDVPIDLTVGSYFTKGIDRAYPDKWAKSYPSYNLLRNVEQCCEVNVRRIEPR